MGMQRKIDAVAFYFAKFAFITSKYIGNDLFFLNRTFLLPVSEIHIKWVFLSFLDAECKSKVKMNFELMTQTT